METADTYIDLLFGYSAIWIVFIVFLFRLMREQSRLSSELKELKAERN